ncbi:MAG: hypothetical protein EOP45_21150, partial [Sphingobacteriaceae bacterium]
IEYKISKFYPNIKIDPPEKIPLTRPVTKVDPLPDPVLEIDPYWLESTSVEDPWFARYWAYSPFKNATLKVKNFYLNMILEKEYEFSSERYDKLLIGINVGGGEFQRRSLIRTHQIDKYKEYNITWRFFIGRVSGDIKESVKTENDTYGDIVVLDHVPDLVDESRTIKLFEFFRYVEAYYPVYKYVAKMDTDCFLNIPVLLKDFFTKEAQDLELGIMALFVTGLGRLEWAQGGFEAYSYKLMILINRIYERIHRTVYEEDFQIGWYLNDAEVNFTKVSLTPSRAYDFMYGNREIFKYNDRDIHNDTVRIHELKKEEDYIMVSACFNEYGVNYEQVLRMRAKNWTLNYSA